jgi:hypothetical protein
MGKKTAARKLAAERAIRKAMAALIEKQHRENPALAAAENAIAMSMSLRGEFAGLAGKGAF